MQTGKSIGSIVIGVRSRRRLHSRQRQVCQDLCDFC